VGMKGLVFMVLFVKENIDVILTFNYILQALQVKVSSIKINEETKEECKIRRVSAIEKEAQH
jgi:hypothetical protein